MMKSHINGISLYGENMKTVILCGGYGTRIRGVDDDLPKPMIPIKDKPIIWHIMNYYSYFNHKDFILCLGYKSHIIKEYFMSYQTRVSDVSVKLGTEKKIDFLSNDTDCDWSIMLAETGLNTMTGGRISKIKKYIGDDEIFMLTYGDGLGDIDLDKLVEFHKSHGKILTVTGVRPPGRFGEIDCDENGIVRGFNEKPQSLEGVISGGFFVCNREIFNYLTDSDDLVFEKDPIENLVKDKQLVVYSHNGFWQPMDTFREYKLLNEMYDAGNAPWVKEK